MMIWGKISCNIYIYVCIYIYICIYVYIYITYWGQWDNWNKPTHAIQVFHGINGPQRPSHHADPSIWWAFFFLWCMNSPTKGKHPWDDHFPGWCGYVWLIHHDSSIILAEFFFVNFHLSFPASRHPVNGIRIWNMATWDPKIHENPTVIVDFPSKTSMDIPWAPNHRGPTRRDSSLCHFPWPWCISVTNGQAHTNSKQIEKSRLNQW